MSKWAATLAASLLALPALARPNDDRWWPTQALPKAIVRVNQQQFSEPLLARQMLAQSIAGLAAKAVNEGRGDELVWIDNANANLEDWLSRLQAARSEVKVSGPVDLWDLAQRYADRGFIKGYILYRLDVAGGEARRGMDASVNVATSLAGLLDGVLIDESLEKEAQAHGLKLLFDARGRSQSWCFGAYKNQFNRRLLCNQDPRKPHSRDLAIAQQALTVYGPGLPTAAMMEWLDPLSPILGWGGNDEFEATDLVTRYGDFQTSTDWCLNLPVLMAASESWNLPKMRHLDPTTIDWQDRRAAVSFVDTDGDNVQWLQGNFFVGGEPGFWRNPDRGKIPFGWSCCFAHLAQLCPETIAYALASRATNDCFIEWGGGYYYPDHFASARSNRWELLATHARRTWAQMQKTDTRVIGFNFVKIDSPDARKACQIFANQTDGLLAILAFQYDQYAAGDGLTFWVKDPNGVDVPVISARYSIWNHTNDREHSGTPAKVARVIRETAQRSDAPRYDWVICHAWSYFKKSPVADDNAEDMPQENAPANGGQRGYAPALWCAERLPADIRVVNPEELIWRLRMQHNPAQTKQAIVRFDKRQASED